jgi:L-asparagine oxygenase
MEVKWPERYCNYFRKNKMHTKIDVSNWFENIHTKINTEINPYNNPEEFLGLAEKALHELSYEQLEPLLKFKSGQGAGYIILSGLRQDPDLIPTYESTKDIISLKKQFYSEFWLAMVAKALGEPIGYAQEKNGELFQNIRPKKGQECKIASDSSKITLDLHVENGYHPIRPDFLMLYCLRSDRNQKGHTLTVELQDIISLANKDDIDILREKRFKTSVDWNFGNIDAERGTGPLVSVIFGSHSNPMIFWDDEYIIGMDSDAQKALENLRKLLHDHMYGILLNPGEIIIYDNYRCLHGRTPFEAHYDGHDRWLQRLLVVRDITLNQKVLQNSGRVLDWLYTPKSNYNNVIY